MAEAAGAPLIVAIDGPAGVGKSTAARALAERLGVPYLDTGAMYRALGLKVLRAGIDADDREAVEELAASAAVGLEADPETGGWRVLLDGRPVGEGIRAPEVTDITSRISVYPGVRRRLVALQRETARRHGGVVEGRDIGTRVFPDTPHKFYLDARPEVRAHRRRGDLRRAGRDVPLAELTAELERRDRRDRERADSPLACDGSYTVLDTSELAAEDVVERMLAAIRTRGQRAAANPGG